MMKFVNGNKIKNKNNKKPTDPQDVLNTSNEGENTVETSLSIPKHWKTSEEEKYVYAFHNTQSPKLKKNQLSIYGMELLRQSQTSIKVTALIRSTVSEPIQFEEATIILSGTNKEPLARKKFDLKALGTLPRNSARPWEFTFDKKDFLVDINEPIDNWSLGFELKQEHRLDLEESWAKSIKPETKSALKKIIADAPQLKQGEMNFMGINADMKENGELAVTILIRNGSEKHINLEKIPLAVKDANGEEIARGSFTMDNFQVKANTSKPWSFIFPEHMVSNKAPDLSRWQAYVIQ